MGQAGLPDWQRQGRQATNPLVLETATFNKALKV
jgi:hypothetical protein